MPDSEASFAACTGCSCHFFPSTNARHIFEPIALVSLLSPLPQVGSRTLLGLSGGTNRTYIYKELEACFQHRKWNGNMLEFPTFIKNRHLLSSNITSLVHWTHATSSFISITDWTTGPQKQWCVHFP